MLARSSLVSALLLVASVTCFAQQTPVLYSYFKVVNATGDKENLPVLINNEAIHPRGIAAGIATGVLAIPPASYTFKAKHPVHGEVSFVLDAKVDAMTSIVFHLRVGEKKDDEPPKTELAYRLFDARPPDADDPNTLTMLQVTNVRQLEVMLGTTPYNLEYEKPFVIPVPKAAGMFPRVAFRNFMLGTLNLEMPEDRVVVFFTDPEGTLKMIDYANEFKKRR